MKQYVKFFALGFISIYIVLCGVFIFHLTQINKIPIETNIPQYKLENQFLEKQSFNDFKGKYLLVDFWFAGCKPCVDEMKYFPELLKKYNSDLTILSLSIDKRELTSKLLKNKPKPFEFIESNNENWIFQNDDMKEKSYVKDLGINSYPTYLLFNKEGTLISSPNSGIAGVEYELGGLFDMSLTIKSKTPFFTKFLALIIPYTILFGIIIFSIRLSKRFIKKY